jgi:hypothetical protein
MSNKGKRFETKDHASWLTISPFLCGSDMGISSNNRLD